MSIPENREGQEIYQSVSAGNDEKVQLWNAGIKKVGRRGAQEVEMFMYLGAEAQQGPETMRFAYIVVVMAGDA